MAVAKGSGNVLRDAFLDVKKGLQNNSRGIKAVLLTLLVLGILTAIATLGIHYEMGFDNLNKWIGTMKYGPYLGTGLGAAMTLFIGTLGTAIYATTPKAIAYNDLDVNDFLDNNDPN